MNRSMSAMGVTFLMLAALALAGCSGSGQQVTSEAAPVDQMPGVERIENADIEVVQQRQKIQGCGPYDTVLVQAFEVSDQFRQDYPDAVNQCIFSMMSHLRNKSAFSKVAEAGGDVTGNALMVEGKILDMRIASTAARIWGGALAGSSYMHIYMKLTDVSTGNVVDEKVISSSSNPFGAAWTGGASDKSLPMDLGKIIGEYIYTVIPAKP